MTPKQAGVKHGSSCGPFNDFDSCFPSPSPFYFRNFWPDYFLHFPLKEIKPQEAEFAQHGYLISFSLILKKKSLPLDKKASKYNKYPTLLSLFSLRMVAMKADFRAAYLDTKVPIKERIYPVCQRYAG